MTRKEIGISSWAFPWAIGVNGYEQPKNPMNIHGLLEKAKELDAGVLQIADNVPLKNCNSDELTFFAAKAAEYRITPEAGTRGLLPENLFCYLEIAKKTGAKLIRTLPHDGDDRPSLLEAVSMLKNILPEFERYEIKLAVENHDFYSSQWFAELIQKTSSPSLGICLDPVNNLGQGESEQEVFANLAPYTINFHCKDYTIKRKPSMLGFNVEGAPTGQGRLDLNHAKKVLQSGISWIIESWTPWQENIEKTISCENEWAAKGISCLKNL